MMRNTVMAVVVGIAVLTSGCIDTVTHVRVANDGSGTIMLRAYFDEEATKGVAGGAANMMGQMMGDMMGDMMGEMAAGMGEAMGGEQIDAEQVKAEIKMGIQEGFEEGATVTMTETAGPKSFYDEAQARKLAGAFGESVRFFKGREISHRDGRKGFEAFYAFNDINKVVVGQEISDTIIESAMGGQGQPAADVETMAEAYRFAFRKGDTATLSIKPPPTKEEMEKEWLAKASPEEVAEHRAMMAAEAEMEAEDEADMGNMNAAMNAQMEQQFLAAFKGRKDCILVAVEGTVKSCNATHRSTKRPNTILVVHMDYDKMLSNPKGKELLMNAEDSRVDFIKAATAEKVPGLVIEDPTKTVVVKFE